MSPLLAQSGHPWLHRTCPLSGVKQTCCFAVHMSAFDPKRTSVLGPTRRFCCANQPSRSNLKLPVTGYATRVRVVSYSFVSVRLVGKHTERDRIRREGNTPDSKLFRRTI